GNALARLAPDDPKRAEPLFDLAELLAARARLTDPPAPHAFDGALAAYETLVDTPAFQHFDRMNEALILDALALVDAGDTENANIGVDRVRLNNPTKEQEAIADVTSAKLAFDAGKLDTADRLYRAAIERVPGTDVARFAEYRLAWTLYSEGQTFDA